MNNAVASFAPKHFSGPQAGPLTFQQQFFRVLHRNLMNHMDGIYPYRISGTLDAEALRKSIEELVRRHESLRARVFIDDHIQMQSVDEPCEHQLDVIRVAGESDGILNADVQARQLVEQLARQVIDLNDRPLFETKLLQLSPREHVLIFSFHHLISDHITRRSLLRELWLLYDALLGGERISVPKPRMQYSDYRVWQQRAHLAWLSQHQPYWKTRLAGAMGIQWPLDVFTPGVNHGPIAKEVLSFSRELSVRLRDLAKRHRTFLSLVMLTAYIAVLARWCGQRDFIVATVSAGRDRIEHQHVAGYFAHMIYLRVQLAGAETFSDLLGRVSQEYYRTLFRKDFGGLVLDNLELSAGAVVQWMPMAGVDPTRVHLTSPSASDLTIKHFPFEGVSPLPVTHSLYVHLWEADEIVSCSATYRTEAFSTSVAQRLLDDLQMTAQLFCGDPNTQVL